jgi:D-aminoacyl-tRNA deacylase
MRVVIQRVIEAKVTVNQQIVGAINNGLVVLVGVTHTDTLHQVELMAKKITQLRIFNDEQGLMNKSVLNTQGSILLISQFTLYGDARKGNRPSFIQAAPPPIAFPLYEALIQALNNIMPLPIATGIFGADMKVQLVNDGPVTIVLDS